MKTQKIILFLCATLSALFADGQNPIFEKDKCTVLSEDNKVTQFVDTVYKGKSCLKLDSKQHAIALAKDLDLKNFRIKMDIAGQVMSGLGFHVADKQNYQFIYFRPGYGGTQEAIQYIPVYNGGLSWIFYNYPAYEKTADINGLEWFHATIEVRGKNLKVFVNNSKTPQMDVTLLNTELTGGNMLLRSMFGPSYFANVTVEPLTDARRIVAKAPDNTFLTDWEISGQFPKDKGHDFDYFLKEAAKSNQWKKINDPHDSYVNLCRYFENPSGVVVSKKQITVTEEIRKWLYFDFGGRLQIMLNGEEVFKYDKKHKFERVFDGTFSVSLDLKKGKNELVFITEGDADFFGKGWNSMGRHQHQNWGFIAQLEETE